MGLKDAAADLAALVEQYAEPADRGLVVVESAQVVAEAASTSIDYVLSRMHGQDDVSVLGEAIVFGARAAAEDVGADPDQVAEAAVSRLENMARSARETLAGMTPAPVVDEASSAASRRALKALQDGASDLQAIADAGFKGDTKAAAKALHQLQQQGVIDYNLKRGYTLLSDGK